MMLWKNNVTKKLQTKENRKSAAVTEVNVSEHTTFLKAELPTTELILYKLEQILDGNLDEIIDALVTADQAAKLAGQND